MIFTKIILHSLLHVFCIVFLTACSPEQGVEVEECFFKASLTKANYSTENSALFRSMKFEISDAYNEGNVAHFPYGTGYSLYLGGTCAQAKEWKARLEGRLKIEDITKEIYWRDFKEHNEFEGIIPFEDPEDK